MINTVEHHLVQYNSSEEKLDTQTEEPHIAGTPDLDSSVKTSQTNPFMRPLLLEKAIE